MQIPATVFLIAALASTSVLAKAETQGDWVLREIEGRPAVADAQTTMQVTDGEITGSGGCNSYSGYGEIGHGRVRIGLLAMTKMGSAADILEQEARFASALPSSARYEVDSSGTMRVYDAKGRLTMRLSRAH